MDHVNNGVSEQCWGENTYGYGQLGYDHNNRIGDSASEMGDNMEIVDLGASFGAVQEVISGLQWRCALSRELRMKVCAFEYRYHHPCLCFIHMHSVGGLANGAISRVAISMTS